MGEGLGEGGGKQTVPRVLVPASVNAVGWLVGWLTSPQHASVSQGRICTDKCVPPH